MSEITKKDLRPYFEESNQKATRVVEFVIHSYFVFGIFLAFFYDTWIVGIGVGILALALYHSSKYFFPDKHTHHYMASLVLAIFMAQFIYQMHGLFEMHFTAFIAIITLIAYQNIWVFLPATLFIVIHHSIFAYVQYIGFISDKESYQNIYFTQLDYMDLQTFVFHAGLVAVGVVIAAKYSEDMRKRTVAIATSLIKLKRKEEQMEVNVDFANSISKGDFDTEYDLNKEDTMGRALVDMRDNLKEGELSKEREAFINKGLTEAGNIVRNNSESMDQLAINMVSFIVKYTGLNQGGIFVVSNDENGEDQVLELKGCYAYSRQKYIEKKVEIGQGLVGQAFLEGNVIYLKEIPDNYVHITSGLGDAPPSVIAIIPIKSEDSIEGVIELAGFDEIPQYRIDFLKEVAENLAVAISSTKISQRTKELYEQSQQQTEEMRAQEEEMRQNMEELSATQEEMTRKQQEYEKLLEEANQEIAQLKES